MRESELQVDHALGSAALISDLRMVLDLATTNYAGWSEEVASLIDRIDTCLAETPDDHAPIEWRTMVAGLRTLASLRTCIAIARGADGDLVRERTKCDVLIVDMRSLLSSVSLVLPAGADVARQSLLQRGQWDADTLRTFLLLIPLPVLYWHNKEVRLPRRESSASSGAAADPILRVIVFLDNAPVASPQILKPDLLYPLVFQVIGLAWPEDATRLRLDLLTTCPPGEFSVSEFVLDRPAHIEDEEYRGELTGQIRFNSAQSSLLDDLVFKIRGAFEAPNGHFSEIPVIGHNELRLRAVNEDNYPLMTGNRRLDRHVVELVTALVKDSPPIRDELPDLLAMLHALTRLLATYAQEAVFKGRSNVPESAFQKMVLRDLRFILGSDVQEHPNQAGGITDIRYRGVIVELKVEDEDGNREHMAEKYTAQPTQYAGVEARQVSVLLVLDLTAKDQPPGDIRNDIMLTDVETHGGTDEARGFPSKAFIFVVNGNMKSPSGYSR